MTQLGAQPVVDASLLAKIQQPTRLMVGDRDTVVSIDETLSAVQGMPRAQLAVLPGSPHPFEQLHLALVASLVRDFAQSATDPRRI
jgi:pimeloyl-ACP methyl ester carboxylesterase